MPYRLTIDTMPGGRHDREPAMREWPTLAEAIDAFERQAAKLCPPFELTIYYRENETLNGRKIRRLTEFGVPKIPGWSEGA